MFKMPTKGILIGCLLSTTLFVGFSCFPAASLAQTQQQDLTVDVTALENRYFFHQYQHDPIEKRLERLELLVFGSAQGGASADRLVRLKTTIAQRDKQAAQDLAAKNKADKNTSKAPGGSSAQYPVLNTLEWRVLKKTHPTLSLDERLSQLETHLFGQPSAAMSYADRVERLQKTIGIGVARGEPQRQGIPQGPLPKAQAGRGFSPGVPFYDGGQMSPFMFDGTTPFGSVPFSGGVSPMPGMPGMPNMPGLESFSFSFGNNGLDDAQAAQVQKRMNALLKHFSNMMGVPLDERALPNFTMPMPNPSTIPFPKQPMLPKQALPFAGPKPGTVPSPEQGTIPLPAEPSTEQVIPPYADPNSI